jgi:hypothetical protein
MAPRAEKDGGDEGVKMPEGMEKFSGSRGSEVREHCQKEP